MNRSIKDGGREIVSHLLPAHGAQDDGGLRRMHCCRMGRGTGIHRWRGIERRANDDFRSRGRGRNS